jgi:hypothetical protein
MILDSAGRVREGEIMIHKGGIIVSAYCKKLLFLYLSGLGETQEGELGRFIFSLEMRENRNSKVLFEQLRSIGDKKVKIKSKISFTIRVTIFQSFGILSHIFSSLSSTLGTQI